MNTTYEKALCERAIELGLDPHEYDSIDTLQEAVELVATVECPRCFRYVAENDIKRDLCSDCENAVYDEYTGN